MLARRSTPQPPATPLVPPLWGPVPPGYRPRPNHPLECISRFVKAPRGVGAINPHFIALPRRGHHQPQDPPPGQSPLPYSSICKSYRSYYFAGLLEASTTKHLIGHPHFT